MGCEVDEAGVLCDFSFVRILRQAIGFIFILALFVGSGPNGACSIWGVTGIDHDHHEGQESVVLFEETGFCEQPSVPCNDANEELPDLQLSIPVDSQKQFSHPLIGVIPAPATEFGAYMIEAHIEPLLYYESVRLVPVSRRVIFCSFLI